jgi:hypothetical protein
MAIDRTQLPHGVTLPTHLAEPDARALIATLARHYGMNYVLFGREDIEKRLPGNTHCTTESGRWRHLTDEQWSRVRATAAWTALPMTAERWLDFAGAMDAAIRQSALQCRTCGDDLAGPPEVTWGLCPACLNSTDLDTVRQRPCPVTADDRPHQWEEGRCRNCRLPGSTATPPRTRQVPPPEAHLPIAQAA